jgi:pyruvate/2-oxoglutarate dehydrogenase complex dihydrolipoamide acyltransferase (E2) component
VPELTVVLPKWGMTMQDATVVEWLVAEGDRVEADQPICVIETDKVNAEVVAPQAGVVGPLLVQPEDVVEVGAAMTTISGDGDG